MIDLKVLKAQLGSATFEEEDVFMPACPACTVRCIMGPEMYGDSIIVAR